MNYRYFQKARNGFIAPVSYRANPIPCGGLSPFAKPVPALRSLPGVAISSGGDTDAGDMTIGGTKKGFTFHALCLEVYSSVEMVAPKFGEIST